MSPTLSPETRRRLALGLISSPAQRNRRRRWIDRITHSNAYDRMRCRLLLHEFEVLVLLAGLVTLCILAAASYISRI